MADFGPISSFLWGTADLIRDSFRRGHYQDVILPMTVLRRIDCVLAPTHDKVLQRYEKLKGKIENLDLRFNEALDENPGEHFTPRDVVRLMARCWMEPIQGSRSRRPPTQGCASLTLGYWMKPLRGKDRRVRLHSTQGCASLTLGYWMEPLRGKDQAARGKSGAT